MKTILNCTESPKEARTSKNKTSKQPKTKKGKNYQLGEMTRYRVLNIKVPFYFISINDQNTL